MLLDGILFGVGLIVVFHLCLVDTSFYPIFLSIVINCLIIGLLLHCSMTTVSFILKYFFLFFSMEFIVFFNF